MIFSLIQGEYHEKCDESHRETIEIEFETIETNKPDQLDNDIPNSMLNA